MADDMIAMVWGELKNELNGIKQELAAEKTANLEAMG